MGSDSSRSGTSAGIFCRAGQWTNVLWYTGVLWFPTRRFRVTIDGGTAEWRKWGGGVPPYWQGSFSGSDVFTWYPGQVGMRVDIKPRSDVRAVVTSA